jgi:hypothetical protein
VRGDLSTHELLAYCVADHTEAGKPCFDPRRKLVFRRDGAGHGSGPYRHDHPIRLVGIASRVRSPVELRDGQSEIEPIEAKWCNVLARSDV